jgi:ankyrin repeat protein
MLAAERGHLEIVKYLVQSGADTDRQDEVSVSGPSLKLSH